MEKYKVEIPKIICLIIVISKFAKQKRYYNTNDLIKLANKIKPELIRLRKDKNDYKYFDDTNFGGLRGNFSTALTFRGIIKKNNRYTTYYGLGKTDRLFNAFKKGKIILDTQQYYAYTSDVNLKKLLEQEAINLNIREKQAHIKIHLQKNKNLKIKRDKINFKKLAVVKSENNIYYLRILFNTFIKPHIIEYNMYQYFCGNKLKQFNLHPLFAIPNDDNIWGEIYVIDSKEVLKTKPLFIYFDKKKKEFYDDKGNKYPYLTLDESLEKLSNQDGNIEERLEYDWSKLKKSLAEDEIISQKEVEKDEFSIFLEKFLHWEKEFTIENKKVVDYTVSSSGGVDVTLKYSGGTTQKLELEHKWNNYILHNHYKSNAWKDAWLYADEEWNFEKIKKVFTPYLSEFSNNVPKVFLCSNKQTGAKEAYEVNWNELEYKKLNIKD